MTQSLSSMALCHPIIIANSRHPTALTAQLDVTGRAESLNLAAAAAILLYTTARRQATAAHAERENADA